MGEESASPAAAAAGEPAKFTEADDDRELVDALFDEVDADQDGSISQEELRAALQRRQDQAELAKVLEGLLRAGGGAAAAAGGIDRAAFRKAFDDLPRVRGERVQWARGLGVEGEVARRLRRGDVLDGLRGLKGLSDEEAERHVREVCSGVAEALPGLLRAALKRLRSPAAQTEVQAHMGSNSKFALDGAFVGKFATLDDFHRGPESLIGIPNPKVRQGMEDEHTRRGNCRTRFTTTNYNVTTDPQTEWEFVVSQAASQHCPVHNSAD